jgi:transposase-like protein
MMALPEESPLIPVFSEEDCIAYFYSIKWPNGFRCPECGHSHAYKISTRRLPLYQCHHCQHQTTLTAGTVMERSHTPLSKWRIAFHLMSESSGVNAVQLSKLISVTYKTAWSMLRKIRQAISRQDALQPLTGKVRGGLGIFGHRTLQPFDCHPKEHPVVAAASYQNGEPAYIKLKLINRNLIDKRSLHPSGKLAFMNEHVRPGTSDFRMLERFWFHTTLLPQIFEQAKTWIDRTFHGIGAPHLQAYWDEFCFRLNQSHRKEPATDALCRICMSS